MRVKVPLKKALEQTIRAFTTSAGRFVGLVGRRIRRTRCGPYNVPDT
jgi:hypothetical protein